MDAKALALSDNGNPYRLWDQHKTLGCKCDAGYSGPDCSLRVCKYGTDPLYSDDVRNVRNPTFTYQINTAGAADSVSGNYSIIFYDRTGEDWQTAPIAIAATCPDVITALEALPNKVVPPGSVLCYRHASNAAAVTGAAVVPKLPVPNTGFDTLLASPSAGFKAYAKYTISFTGNPGKLKQPQINLYLDGSRPTLTSTENPSTVNTYTYINGFGPEDQDFAPDQCPIQVTITGTGPYLITPATDADIITFKKCLGDSDGNIGNNREVYNWDYGAGASGSGSPHLIKLVDATQDLSATVFGDVTNSNTFDASKQELSKTKLCRDGSASCNSPNPPGFYAVVYWDDSAGVKKFKLVSNPGAIYSVTTQKFNVFTSQSWLKLISSATYTYGGTAANSGAAEVSGPAGSSDISIAARADGFSNVVYTATDISCETDPTKITSNTCIEKGDYIMIFDVTTVSLNPEFLNIYQVQKIEITPPKVNVGRRYKITLDYGVNANYVNANGATGKANIYKLSTVNTYKYVDQCSGRGICDTSMGTCSCFKGYTMDNCNTQSALVN